MPSPLFVPRSVAVVPFALAVAACGSSGSGGPADGSFGFGNEGGKAEAGAHGDSGSDAGKDSSHPPPPDASCGATPPSDWCATNAPMAIKTSNVLCDDFDFGAPSSTFNFQGVTRSNFVNTGGYVSPYCALQATIGSGGGTTSTGAYTEHVYPLALSSATAKLAFDVLVPGGSACEGAVLGRFLGTSQAGSETDAAKAWLTLSGITGTGGAPATGYTISLTAQVGVAGATGGPASSPVTITVAPRASDKGWVRLELDISAYTVAANPASVTGKVGWYYPGGTAAQSTSTAGTASGTLTWITDAGANAAAAFDFGLIPDPTSAMAPSACTLYLDDVVSDIE